MKKYALKIVLLLFIAMFSSCSIIYFNDDNQSYLMAPGCLSMGCKFDNNFVFTFDINVPKGQKMSCFTIHSLRFLNKDGDTIPYKLLYHISYCKTAEVCVVVRTSANHKTDTIPYRPMVEDRAGIGSGVVDVSSVEMPISFIHKASEQCAGQLEIDVELYSQTNPVKVCYDVEINGTRQKDEVWFKKKLYLNSRITGAHIIEL